MEEIKRNTYPKIKSTLTFTGDGTVPAMSSLVFPLKWAKEFENGEGKYPVKFLEYCAKYNEDLPLYDSYDHQRGNIISRNEYFGIHCECIEKCDLNSCDLSQCNHSKMLSDKFLMETFFEIINVDEIPEESVFERID